MASSEALLGSIMNAFHDQLSAGYDAVLAANAPPLARLDALTWLNLNVLGRFGPELAIQAGPAGSAPPPPEVLAACVRDLSWLPAWMVQQQGARAALAHSRATLIRGVALRG